MQRGADLKRRKCELQIETNQLTIEAAYRVQIQESKRDSKAKEELTG